MLDTATLGISGEYDDTSDCLRIYFSTTSLNKFVRSKSAVLHCSHVDM